VAVITALSAHDDTPEVSDLRARIEQQLLAAAKSGRKRVPFGELFERHGKKVFSVVHWMMRNREDNFGSKNGGVSRESCSPPNATSAECW
jgi:hypothetical protein